LEQASNEADSFTGHKSWMVVSLHWRRQMLCAFHIALQLLQATLQLFMSF
jgi:hypothetical protein